MAIHLHRSNMQCHQVVSVFGFSSASLGYSCFSCPLLLLAFSFYFSSFIPFHLSFRSYEFTFELFLPSFLLAVLYQLLACSSWQFHASILLVLLPTGPLGLFLCPLPLGPEFGCIFASDGDVLPWRRLNLGKPAFCGFTFVDLD